MRTVMIGCAVVMAWAFLAVSVAPAAELTVDAVRDLKGDGPDGKANTADDTWGFWFQLVRMQDYRRLDLATEAMSADQRQNGIVDGKARRGKRKVQGPIAAMTPNPKDTEGWIYHSDWDGRYEGVWGDKKDKQVIAHPYNEKTDGGAVAVTYKVPADGTYTISGKVTDLTVAKIDNAFISGIKAVVDILENDPAQTKAPVKTLGTTGPLGDKVGPESGEFKYEKVALKKGQLVRLAIDPNGGWATDMTRIDSFKIEPVTSASANWKTPALAAALLAAAGVAGLFVRRMF